MIPLTTEKIAVFAPIPNARVTIVTTANPGDRRRLRTAWRTSRTRPSIVSLRRHHSPEVRRRRTAKCCQPESLSQGRSAEAFALHLTKNAAVTKRSFVTATFDSILQPTWHAGARDPLPGRAEKPC